MLTFEQKLDILASFPELERKNVSLGRVNFHYENSAFDKKNVVYHLHPNGNGYVYAGLVPGIDTDEKGFVNIRDASESEIRELVAAAIASLSLKTGDKIDTATAAAPTLISATTQPELWIGPEDAILRLTFEDELWYVFSGDNLESAFETCEEALEYLSEEGFTPA